MSELKNKHCVPCEGGTQPLSIETAQTLLKKIPEWVMDTHTQKITRRYQFKNFYHTMGFVNAIAWISNQEKHHPDLEIGYNYCTIHFTTHAINGLSENDFICAAKIDQLKSD